jgi:hypothetical protein
MNVLDENITVVERERLRHWNIPVRHIGYDIGRKGMDDEIIIPFLLTLRRPTFFTEDWDYFSPRLCHAKYCLVHLDVKRDDMAFFARRLLRHPEFSTQAKRMGKVIRASQTGLMVWQRNAKNAVRVRWAD